MGGVVLNTVIVYLIFAVLSIGLLILAEVLVKTGILSKNYGWTLILIRYIIAIVALILYSQKVVHNKFNFEFDLKWLSIIGWVVTLIFIVFNFWYIGDNDFTLSNNGLSSLLYCLGPAIFEELWLRGLIFNRLRIVNKLDHPLFKATFISAALFAVLHLILPDYSNWLDLLTQIITAFGLGVLFAGIYCITNNLALTMLIHFSENFNSYFITYLPWFDDFDLNDFIVNLIQTFIYLIIGIFLLWLFWRKKNSVKRND
ncbi:CPBP family intramembrane glutamic endopeptidase [Lactobacillus kefiranofaciens]|uniref:CPBP family intramembrane glutamic endopeptidase n=1 Tax=Lactobacillus kefiranofaciens TaxID=267818 RepID=UPI0021C455E6|nr:CPBP family intramembrane glutamic endopeptidase [Lactobacillus kefiranofaciens]MCP9330023.1 CPBP family intramembrane metalloprotease [Lactobacillus kefiranofaciens]